MSQLPSSECPSHRPKQRNEQRNNQRDEFKHRLIFNLVCLFLAAGLLVTTMEPATAAVEVDAEAATDVLIYGATPAGIAAAIAAARDDCQVLIVEPTNRIGGLVTSGLSHTDYHSRESLSGAFLEFSATVREIYSQRYGPQSQQVADSHQGVFAEPHVNLEAFELLLRNHTRIQIKLGHQLQSIKLDGDDTRHIKQAVFANGPARLTVMPSQVIDATYEGDLMKMAGCKYHVGREGRSTYGESLAPEQSDAQLQAYNFRFVMTKTPRNRVTPEAPVGYRREDFVGVLDALSSGKIDRVFGYPSRCIFKAHEPPLPNGKYDINDVSSSLVRLSLPGANLLWPEGSSLDRRGIYEHHMRDQVGLLYFLQNDTAVPEKFRSEAREWGWCRDEFEASGHLPPQLYVREARRMQGVYVYTQRDSMHAPGDARAVLHPSSIAMGDYGNNCHGTLHEGPRFGGKHTGEFYNPVPPYQIPYEVLLPQSVDNLLVPGAVSSSHVGFCALRLEPIWMSLGQAAGHASASAHKNGTSVQRVPVRPLQKRLREVGSALIYVSDVLVGHPDFIAVQWWGTLGGLHGLEPMPAKPGQRGEKLHGQYYAATPGHAARLDEPLDAKTYERWHVLASMQGIDGDRLPAHRDNLTRGEFIRRVYEMADKLGLTSHVGSLPRSHRDAVANTHPPGEVDNARLALRVISDPAALSGIVIDDCDAELVGQWQLSTHTPPYVGAGYLHDMYEGKGTKSVTYRTRLPRDGVYEVRLSHCSNVRRTTSALVTIGHAGGESELRINQQQPAEHGELFKSLGRFTFRHDQPAWVQISNAGADEKVVIADAVQFLPVETN